ncbi:MAG: ribosome silencing factor [Bacteroidetes bacterium]|nr:ribosome silencing factor [Bacteroidota bacterium]
MTTEITSKLEQTETLLNCINEALLEKKAENILQLEVSSISSITDYFIICHAGSDTQVKALASNVVQKVNEDLEERPIRREGMDTRRWVTIDYGNIIVHIFLAELRKYYQLEKMWSDAIITEITD